MAEGNLRVENPENRPMHYGDFTVGRLNPPDYIPKYRLYSYFDGEKRYNEIQHDLYESSKKAKPKKKTSTPLILKIAAGIAVLYATILGFLKFKK